jgi:O-methyltransferase
MKKAFRKRYLAPLLCRYNWRPAKYISIEKPYLQPVFGYDDEALIKNAVEQLTNYTMASFERLATLWQQVHYLDRYNIPGSFIECGVWRGGCAGMMALAHLHTHKNPVREIHLFDSFQGLPQPDRNFDGPEALKLSGGLADAKHIPIDCCVASIEDCQTLLIDKIGYPSNLVKIHTGWFEDTVPKISTSIPQVSLLRLDGDWYNSTKICLDYFYAKVVKNGIVVIDDYGHFSGCQKAVDAFILEVGEPILLNHIDYTGRFWVKL